MRSSIQDAAVATCWQQTKCHGDDTVVVVAAAAISDDSRQRCR